MGAHTGALPGHLHVAARCSRTASANSRPYRNALLPCYPEDVRLKKLAARAATMAQSGQYNYYRMMRRGDVFGARLALGEFLNAALSMMYLLNFRYEPFYKWQFAGAEGLVAMDERPALPEGHSLRQHPPGRRQHSERHRAVCAIAIKGAAAAGPHRRRRANTWSRTHIR